MSQSLILSFAPRMHGPIAVHTRMPVTPSTSLQKTHICQDIAPENTDKAAFRSWNT
ncbi:hypothetical protein [Castellaniella sp.]|uniref:hypothetical protein n=1 Tax=Castellaniella sp. TaxID=1955812 RepID=UPI003563CA06